MHACMHMTPTPSLATPSALSHTHAHTPSPHAPAYLAAELVPTWAPDGSTIKAARLSYFVGMYTEKYACGNQDPIQTVFCPADTREEIRDVLLKVLHWRKGCGCDTGTMYCVLDAGNVSDAVVAAAKKVETEHGEAKEWAEREQRDREGW